MFTINIAKGSSKKRTTNSIKKISTITKALVVLQDGIFYAKVFDGTFASSSYKLYKFTERSYDLKNKLVIFSKTRDKKHNKYTAIVRNADEAKRNAGSSNLYTPFRPEITISGYIVAEKGLERFDYKSFVAFAHSNEPFKRDILME